MAPSVTEASKPLVFGKLVQEDNAPWAFWKLVDDRSVQGDWLAAGQEALGCLQGLALPPGEVSLQEILPAILAEGQFGPDHWRLSGAKRVYYGVRALLPTWTRSILRRLLVAGRKNESSLQWPIEDRYVRHQFDTVRWLLEEKGVESVRYLHFWPDGKRFAFVLTHDVEANHGQQFVREIANLEEGLGFRSSFNFVPELYPVDVDLLEELRERGFEVGVHGLKHDGKLFSSETTFLRRAERINRYLKEWGAAGFRSPMTHRNPEWMQALEIEYDSSFFDTDPFEPIPGGTMSIWPFMMGRFVELPYTLVQDHTLLVTLGETTPKLWLEKVEFIRRYSGMALSLTHPDYLRDPSRLAVYERFLRAMRDRDDYWHALPREVARWWRARAEAESLNALPGGTMGEIRLVDGGIDLLPVEAVAREAPNRSREAAGAVQTARRDW